MKAIVVVVVVALAAAVLTSSTMARPSPYRVAALAVKRHFPKEQSFAMAVVKCETGSTYDRFATGRAGERGIFQIHPTWFGRRIGRYVVNSKRLYNPWYNAKIAAELRRVAGWSQWTCARYVG